MQPKVPYSNYLVALVAEASTAAGRLLDAPPEVLDALAADAAREASLASARLDGSPVDAETAAMVDGGTWQRPRELLTTERAAGWAGALRLDDVDTHDLAAVEYANLVAAHALEPQMAPRFFDEPLDVLAALHTQLCEGLVDPDVAGRPRTTDQAIHDGAQGRVIFNTPDPSQVSALLDDLQSWLRGDDREGSAGYPAVVVAAVVHELLLQWQPFEAANGRLARAAARLVLRARGLDPRGIAVPERSWVADPGGYYAEVAATIRRRADLGPWIERHTEVLVDAFQSAAGQARPDSAVPPTDRVISAVHALAPGGTITVVEFAQSAGISRDTAWRELRAAALAGELTREPRTLGRRFRRS